MASKTPVAAMHYCAGHSLSIVLIELIVSVTGEGDPDLADVSELVLSDGDCFPVISTR